MTVKKLGAMAKLREMFNSIPRDNTIRGIRTRESYFNMLSEREEMMNNTEDLER